MQIGHFVSLKVVLRPELSIVFMEEQQLFFCNSRWILLQYLPERWMISSLSHHPVSCNQADSTHWKLYKRLATSRLNKIRPTRKGAPQVTDLAGGSTILHGRESSEPSVISHH
jgi:hypothetical protein